MATTSGGFHLFLAHAPGPKVRPHRIPDCCSVQFPLVACRLSNQFVRNHWQLLTAKIHKHTHSHTYARIWRIWVAVTIVIRLLKSCHATSNNTRKKQVTSFSWVFRLNDTLKSMIYRWNLKLLAKNDGTEIFFRKLVYCWEFLKNIAYFLE